MFMITCILKVPNMCVHVTILVQLNKFKSILYSFEATQLHNVKKSSSTLHKRFTTAQLRVLWKRFEKDQFISRTEADELAKEMDIYPEKIFNWFHHQRSQGGLKEKETAIKGLNALKCFI